MSATKPVDSTVSRLRSGGQVLVDQLALQGCRHVFFVPGESYLAVLDALYDSDITQTICRQEGGAAMMAEASAKLTGRPGVCFVTRGPGAMNAGAGIHVAQQDSTPMILFVGQVARRFRTRGGFQEVDFAAVFGSMAKWVVEIDDPRRIPELVSRAYSVAMAGRPGPVVVALPEDMLVEPVDVVDGRQVMPPAMSCGPRECEAVAALIGPSARPLVIVGGSTWKTEDQASLIAFSERYGLPVATSFRRQALFPTTHENYVGTLTPAADPVLVDYARSADLVILIGGLLGELPSQHYSILSSPVPRQKLVHVHPGANELNRVYSADHALNCRPGDFLEGMLARVPRATPVTRARRASIAGLRAHVLDWMRPRPQPGELNVTEIIAWLNAEIDDDAIVCNGAGNYATWVHRFYRYTKPGTQLAPISGSMGYGLPAAVAAKRVFPKRQVVAFSGDGCFMMTGQEFMTAVQYGLPIIDVVIDNGMFGTIRMHQEQRYPGRVSGTSVVNPDFAALARAYGGHGERVERTEDFAAAFRRAVASGKPAVIHCILDPEALTINRSLTAIREQALGAKT